MTVRIVATGKTLYEVTTINGAEIKIKIRDCNTEREAAALAAYYTIRRV